MNLTAPNPSPRSPAQGRAWSLWIGLIIAIAVAGGTIAGIVEIDRREADARDAQLTVTQLRANFFQAQRIFFEFQLEPERFLALAADTARLNVEGYALLDHLNTVAPGKDADLLRVKLDALSAQVVRIPRYLGATATADEAQVATYRAELTSSSADYGASLDAAEQVFSDRADRQHTMARAGTVISLIGAGIVISIILAIADRLRHRNAELRRRQDAHFRTLVQNGADLISVVDLAGRIQFQSPSSRVLLDRAPERLEGLPFVDLLHADDRGCFIELLNRSRREQGETLDCEIRLQHARGEWRDFEIVIANHVDDPDLHGFLLTARDITHRKSLQAELAFLAYHDTLTRLLNRESFLAKLDEAVANANASGSPIALLYLDVDSFKDINDTFGHAEGDRVLVAVANRITAAVRPGDLVARTGGDEFVVLLDATPMDVANGVARRIVDLMKAPMSIGGEFQSVRVSVGVAAVAGVHVNPEELVDRADRAMYVAKRERSAIPRAYDGSMSCVAPAEPTKVLQPAGAE